MVIVEDEEFLRKGLVLATDWNDMNCLVVGEAENAFDGERIIRLLKPDIVLTDVRMPRKTGLAMIEALSDLNGIEYVILSGYADFLYAQKAIELHVFRYLLKPIDDKQLRRIIEDIGKEIEFREKNITQDIKETSSISFGDYRDWYVCEVVDYIKAHYSDPMKVGALAKNLGISESSLTKLFKARTGYSINEYVVRQRMRIAMRLLKKNDMSIAQIGEFVGYKDGRYFSETFKRYFAITPLEFKKGAIPNEGSLQ